MVDLIINGCKNKQTTTLSRFSGESHMLILLVSFASGLGVTICGWWETAGSSATAPQQILLSHSKTRPSHLYLLRLSLSNSRRRLVEIFCLNGTIIRNSFIYDISFLLLRRTPSWFVKLAFSGSCLTSLGHVTSKIETCSQFVFANVYPFQMWRYPTFV